MFLKNQEFCTINPLAFRGEGDFLFGQIRVFHRGLYTNPVLKILLFTSFITEKEKAGEEKKSETEKAEKEEEGLKPAASEL